MSVLLFSPAIADSQRSGRARRLAFSPSSNRSRRLNRWHRVIPSRARARGSKVLDDRPVAIEGKRSQRVRKSPSSDRAHSSSSRTRRLRPRGRLLRKRAATVVGWIREIGESRGEFGPRPGSGLSSWNNKRQSGITRSFHSSASLPPSALPPSPRITTVRDAPENAREYT